MPRSAKLFLALALAASAPQNSDAATLIVGTTAEAAPFAFLDVETNTTVGFSIDLMTAIAREMGVDLEFVAMGFSELIPALMSGQVHAIAANLAMTPEREQLINFTHPLSHHGDGLLVRIGDSGRYTTLLDLAGTDVGAIFATIYWDALVAAGYFRDVRSYPNRRELAEAVANGEIEAALVLGPGFAYDIEVRDAYPGVILEQNYDPLFQTTMGFAVAVGQDDLLGRMNAAIMGLQETGELERLRATWRLAAP